MPQKGGGSHTGNRQDCQEGTAVARGVSQDEAFDFVLDPAQYVKADTKMIWVTKLADLPDGMIAREDGKFLGRFKGSVITRDIWRRPTSIDVVIEHGVPRSLHAWFEITEVDGGTKIRHVEELDLGHGPLGWVHDLWLGAGLPDRSVPRWTRLVGCSRPVNGDNSCMLCSP
jgi:hypothetical protein